MENENKSFIFVFSWVGWKIHCWNCRIFWHVKSGKWKWISTFYFVTFKIHLELSDVFLIIGQNLWAENGPLQPSGCIWLTKLSWCFQTILVGRVKITSVQKHIRFHHCPHRLKKPLIFSEIFHFLLYFQIIFDGFKVGRFDEGLADNELETPDGGSMTSTGELPGCPDGFMQVIKTTERLIFSSSAAFHV